MVQKQPIFIYEEQLPNKPNQAIRPILHLISQFSFYFSIITYYSPLDELCMVISLRVFLINLRSFTLWLFE